MGGEDLGIQQGMSVWLVHPNPIYDPCTTLPYKNTPTILTFKNVNEIVNEIGGGKPP